MSLTLTMESLQEEVEKGDDSHELQRIRLAAIVLYLGEKERDKIHVW